MIRRLLPFPSHQKTAASRFDLWKKNEEATPKRVVDVAHRKLTGRRNSLAVVVKGSGATANSLPSGCTPFGSHANQTRPAQISFSATSLHAWATHRQASSKPLTAAAPIQQAQEALDSCKRTTWVWVKNRHPKWKQ